MSFKPGMIVLCKDNDWLPNDYPPHTYPKKGEEYTVIKLLSNGCLFLAEIPIDQNGIIQSWDEGHFKKKNPESDFGELVVDFLEESIGF